MKTFSLTLVALLGLLVQAAAAGHHGCQDGCDTGCDKGCHDGCDKGCHDGCDTGCDKGCGCQTDCCGNDCSNGCGKVCKLVCETKKIKVICWGCECEDFCVPGCSELACEHCDEGDCCDCNKCPCECKQGPDCRFSWKEWIPGCAEIRTRKKLIKYEAEKEIPSFRWEVVDACGACGNGCDSCGSTSEGGCTKAGCTSAPAGEPHHAGVPTPADESAPMPPSRPVSMNIGR